MRFWWVEQGVQFFCVPTSSSIKFLFPPSKYIYTSAGTYAMLDAAEWLLLLRPCVHLVLLCVFVQGWASVLFRNPKWSFFNFFVKEWLPSLLSFKMLHFLCLGLGWVGVFLCFFSKKGTRNNLQLLQQSKELHPSLPDYHSISGVNFVLSSNKLTNRKRLKICLGGSHTAIRNSIYNSFLL